MTPSRQKRNLLSLNLEKILSLFFDWKIILIFILIVGFSSGLLVFSQIVKREIELSQMPNKIRRSQPFYTKGIYLSSWTAGESEKINQIIDFIRRTGLNTVVIDIKDSTGKVAYNSKIPLVNELNTKELRIRNLTALLEKFYQHGIYTIARIVVFQDPELAVKKPSLALKDRRSGKIWRDYKNLAWVDPASEEVWTYNVALAKEAFELGFDEVNFDYVRFPSDGDTNRIVYPFWDGRTEKSEIIRRFFEYQKIHLEKYGPRSIDLFGLTLWHIEDGFDMNIGQKLVNTLPYFDYICPMVYPSHYPANFEGFINPAQHPYEVIYRSLIKAKPLLGRQAQLKNDGRAYIRPWLQVFDLGAKYNSVMIKEEIRAVEEASGYGWILWNARNDYSEVEVVFKK
ncbi:MAG: putative glycoside hydrolase [Patescibacteria group bacterium]